MGTRVTIGLLGALLGACLPGCKSSGGQTFPDDPLFVNKKPVEVKAENAPPVKLAYVEPVAPSCPLTAVASRARSKLPEEEAEPSPRP